MNEPRTLWVLGNFKQNHQRAEIQAHLRALAPATQALRTQHAALHLGIAPTAAYLETAQRTREDLEPGSPNPLRILAQNVGAQETGAFTGEIGPAMLRDVGCDLTIIGHSERRAMFGDNDAFVARKVQACAQAGLGLVLCVGESLEQRDAGHHAQVVTQQLAAGLAQFPFSTDLPLIIAYEPVWAIGTGRTASPEQARDMHLVLREELARLDGARGRGRSILYGGSVKPTNAADLLAAGEIDGFLVGGASLDPTSFSAIAQAAAEHLSS